MNLEQLKASVPKHSRNMVTEGVVNVMNQLESDHGVDFAEHYKQNFVSFSNVLKSGEYSTTDYVNAVKLVSYKLLNNSDIDAYHMTFPNRYSRLLAQWHEIGSEAEIRSQKISPFVSAYKRNQLVVKLTEQSLIPPRILNAPMFQQALNIQLDIAMTSTSDMVRTTAANSILTHLKQPETTKIELDVSIGGNDALEMMRQEMQRLAAQQQNSIQVGSNTSLEIAESKLMHETIEAEIE